MNTNKDISSFYIRYKNHPYYNENTIITDNHIDSIFNKIEMILFTNKGELLSDINFGCNLKELVHKTYTSAEYIKSVIIQQISEYIPELSAQNYSVNIELYPGEFRDICIIKILIYYKELSIFIS